MSHWEQPGRGNDDVSPTLEQTMMTDFERTRDGVHSSAAHFNLGLASSHTDRGYLSATTGALSSPPTVKKLGMELGPQSFSTRAWYSGLQAVFSKPGDTDADDERRLE